jgi:AcrR family transcriptional regulator
MGRREVLLHEAARLFAERGFHGVSVDDLGAAAGVSGPAVYRHFAAKEAILSEVLLDISRRLLDGGRRRASTASGPAQGLTALVAFHVDFALGEPELITVQGRDLESLPPGARREVRRLQREYVAVWVGALRRSRPDLDEPTARAVVQATFGLVNSTPFSGRELDPGALGSRLRGMALAALAADVA